MTKNKNHYNLAGRFNEQVQAVPEAPALWDDGQIYSYAELGDLTRKISGWLKQRGVRPGSRVGILAGRGVTAITGILGACWAGCAWVPFNPAHPFERISALIDRAEVDALIVDGAGASLLADLELKVQALSPETTLTGADKQAPVPCNGDDLAYLMFTSGTTGIPKGVMINHEAIDHFLTFMQKRYGIGQGDRVSQFFELTFDLSVFDLFMSLGNGATLYLLPESSRLGPAAFIKEQKLTVWFSVPSAIVLMDRFRQLEPGAFPALRLSLFCGEPLPAETVRSWKAAAPESRVDNLYGPTEATLACLLQPCSENIPETPERGCVAIGHPYPGMEVAIMDLENQVLISGTEPGELMLAGPQLAIAYWRDEALTDERFITIDGTRWYRTGDLARQDANGCVHHLGRTDNQVKIMGHRVELEDIETHLRHVCDTETAMVVAWPVNHNSAQGVVAFVADTELSVSEIRRGMKKRVPDYMIPRQVRFVDVLPLSSNGKFDRNALADMLKKPGPTSRAE